MQGDVRFCLVFWCVRLKAFFYQGRSISGIYIRRRDPLAPAMPFSSIGPLTLARQVFRSLSARFWVLCYKTGHRGGPRKKTRTGCAQAAAF